MGTLLKKTPMSKNNKNQKVRNRSRGDKSATSSTASASTSESESVNKNIAKATSNEKSRNLFEKKSFGLPLFALSANDNGYVVAGGGGGAAKTGIKNALIVLRVVDELLEEICRKEFESDSVVSVCLHPK